MRTGYALLLCLAHVLIPAASANFLLKDSYIGHNFFDGWKWETLDDPTHGRVNYVDEGTARASNLSYGELRPRLATPHIVAHHPRVSATDSKFVMRADSFKTVDPGARGRDSVRISSYNAYDESVIVLDLQHMPEGCSTWPAFWSLSQKGPWPKGGEIDFIEGMSRVSSPANLEIDSGVRSRCQSRVEKSRITAHKA